MRGDPNRVELALDPPAGHSPPAPAVDQTDSVSGSGHTSIGKRSPWITG